MSFVRLATPTAIFFSFLAACSSDDSSSEAPTAPKEGGSGIVQADSATGSGNGSANDASTAQTPPMGGTALEAWLAGGAYKSWSCEPAVHANRSPSPHGFNRICSNAVIASNATSPGPWPQGAAAVKELWTSDPDAGAVDGAPPPTAPAGYAVYLKTASDSAAGANWYWYERVPVGGVVADGMGSSGVPQTLCVGCHAAAGSDTAHTPSANGHDEVYTPVSN